MKRLFLRFKNSIAKIFLTVLGFTLAASQCLAQYMAIRPKIPIHVRILGITDTISRFRIVVNERDTSFSTWDEKYEFERYFDYSTTSIKLEVSQDVEDENQKYNSITEVVAIKPDENEFEVKNVDIRLKAKR